MLSLDQGTMFILLAKSKRWDEFDTGMLYLVMSMVGFFVLVLLIIFLRKSIFPFFKLWYITLFYGRFSFEFIDFFRERNLRNPHNNCINDEITLHFLVFYKKIRNAPEFHTEQQIEFGTVPFLTNYKEIVKKKGSPKCINVTTFGETRIKVIGYYETLEHVKLKTLYFFVGEKFILGEYLFSNSNRSKNADLITPLARKYLYGNIPQADSCYIQDPSGNLVNYENNGFSISIRYLTRKDKNSNNILDKLFSAGKQPDESLKQALRQEELFGRF